jgi:hypothetical protein
MSAAICLIAACLIAEGTARRCDPEPDSMVAIERPIGFADTADLPLSRLATRDHRACARIAAELPYPANWRLVSFQIVRPIPPAQAVETMSAEARSAKADAPANAVR